MRNEIKLESQKHSLPDEQEVSPLFWVRHLKNLKKVYIKIFEQNRDENFFVIYLVKIAPKKAQDKHQCCRLASGFRGKTDNDPESSVADPDPGSDAFLTPGSGIRDG